MLNRIKTLPSRLWFRAIVFAIVYFGSALISQSISLHGASYLTIWFPSGLFVAALLLSPVSQWPAYLLAALLVNLSFGFLHGQSLAANGLSFINGALEAVTGAWLIRRMETRQKKFNTPENLLKLIVLSAILSSALSATISTTMMASLHKGFSFWPAWRIGWISHGLGILAGAPLVLSWANARPRMLRKADPEKLIELAVLITGLFVCSLYIFVGNFGFDHQSYMVVPFLVWVALRFGLRGATVSGLIVTLVSSWGLAQRLDGFAVNNMTIAPNMDALGSFLVITLSTCYILAAVWEQGKHTEQALRESEERYRLLVENQGEGVAIVDADEVFLFANPAACQIFGVDILVGRSLKEFTDAPQFKNIREQTDLRRAGQKTIYEADIRQPGGRRCTIQVNATPEYDGSNHFRGTFAVFHDITERIQAEMALRDSRARFQALFDHSPIAIWEEDFSRIKLLLDSFRRDGVEDFREYFNEHPEQINACGKLFHVLDVNRAALQLYGTREKNQFLADINNLLHRGPQDIFVEELVAIAEGKTEFELEGPNDLIDGVIRHHNVRWTVAPGYEKDYRRVIVTIIDVTERRQSEERMRYLSTHDVLTTLYNRNFFEAEMERLQNSRLEPINVMIADVNGMKDTNDTYGHAAGDELLRRTAQVLRMSFRKEDVIARIGGDEFVVLFHGSVSIQDAVNRVHDCLADHNHWYDGPALSLAIGAASGGKGSSLVDLYKKADQQMYKEKLRSRTQHAQPNLEDKSTSKFGNSPQSD